MLGNNPNYDLSMYTDQINVTVEFKDGKVAENVINVTMDENGKTFCELQSYNYN